MRRRKLFIPLVDCILVAHAQITARTNGNQVLHGHITTLALGSVVPTLVIKYTHLVRTPNDLTFCIKLAPDLQQPDLFPQSLWNLLFHVAH
jgi:hypothetical protein